jgi:hypothetical protein
VKDQLRRLLMGRIEKNKDLFLNEARQISGFMKLLMKERNAEGRWNDAERVQLKKYMKRVVAYIPLFCIFLLPGGLLLIPILAEVIDRRKEPRMAASVTSSKKSPLATGA